MATDYSRPGVYIEESAFVDSAVTSTATSSALFVGVAGTGPLSVPVRCATWSDYVNNFGGFDKVIDPTTSISYTSYLPYAVYSYFQNGGRPCFIQRAIGSSSGTAAAVNITGTASFTVTNKVSTTTLATLTLSSAAHGLVVGDVVTVADVGTPFNGASFTLTVVTANTISYALTGTPAAVTSIASTGTVTSATIKAFTVTARSGGTSNNYANSGNAGAGLSINISTVVNASKTFVTLRVMKNNSAIETFSTLTMDGSGETSRLDSTVNDAFSGSKFVTISSVNTQVIPAASVASAGSPLAGGVDANVPVITGQKANYTTSAVSAIQAITGPMVLNLVGFTADVDNPAVFCKPDVQSVAADTSVISRGNVFIINDAVRPRGTTGIATYITESSTGVNAELANSAYDGNSYVASFAPWIIISDPTGDSSTITIPPGGAVAGVISRVDSTVGPYRAPAGLLAGITNAVGVESKFTDTQLGELNTKSINVIRPVTGAGITIMGARTRKIYGPDKYISGRRSLIYIKESLANATQFALFENNDPRLWAQMIMSANRILRPLWEAGGLRGNSASDAYYIKCDATLNPPERVSSGEVRMDIGVALEYPAEFIVIRVTQYESGGITTEVQPRG